MDPLVSVVLPVYNGEPFIASTLESALGQTYRNLEVIVVDDGSRDRTRAIVEARAADDPRIRVISQANRGLAATRNRALEHARGEFVAPLDADDLWDPTKIERQVRRAVLAGEGTGLVYCWWFWIDAQGGVLDSSPRWHFEGSAADALLQINFVGNASVPLFRRRHLEEVGAFDVSIPTGCEDWDVALKVAERSHVAVVPAPLVGYRRHDHNLSSRTGVMWRSYVAVLERTEHRRHARRDVLRRSRDQFALYLAGVAYRSGAYASALGWVVRAMRSPIAFEVLPHALRFLLGGRTSRAPQPRPAIGPGVSFADWEMPPPVIPYDTLYHRRYPPSRPD